MNLMRRFVIVVVLIALASFAGSTYGGEEKAKQKITTPPISLPFTQKAKEKGNVGGGGEAQATTQRPSPWIQSPTPTLIKANSNIELIIDASGSMKGLMDGTTKFEIVKSAILDVLSLPQPENTTRNIGVRVYGNTTESEKSNCEDTTLIVPISAPDKELLSKELSKLEPKGVSPIGFALQKAADDFKEDPNADNVIILLTDGKDSCNANLCEIATNLKNSPKKIITHVIGFDLDKEAEASLECVSKNGDGKFVLVRNANELNQGLEEVLMANVPYNLKLRIMSGATPIPAELTVYKAGTRNVVREDTAFGVKFYQLPPDKYDIEVTYSESVESPKPSKIVRGIELQATSRTEQTVQFELGTLTVSSIDKNGTATAAKYTLQNLDSPSTTATFEAPANPRTVLLTPGTYNIVVESKTPEGLLLTAKAENVKIAKGETVSKEFKFQMGTLKLSGKNAKGEDIPIVYKITPSQNPSIVASEGKLEKGGGGIELPPGSYNLYVSAYIEGLKTIPSISAGVIELGGGDVLEKAVTIPLASLTLSAKDAAGKFVEAAFEVTPAGSNEPPLRQTVKGGPLALNLPPGSYNIKAIYLKTDITPTPFIVWNSVPLQENAQLEKTAVFKFGRLTLSGQNSKGVGINSAFYIYRTGESEPYASFDNVLHPITLTLPEGFYDIKAEDLTSRKDPKPSVWFHNTEVAQEKPATRIAVFTSGKLKMICRGINNMTIPCGYKIFSYGTDSPLFEGETGDQWIEHDISPGSYYIEAEYHDKQEEVILKKWITFHVGDNEIVEEIIKF